MEPQVFIKNHGTSLVKGIDYEVTYENNDEIGTAYAVITGLGNYSENPHSVPFNIVPNPVPNEYIIPIGNLVTYVYTSLSDITLPSNSYGSWRFVALADDPTATVGSACPEGRDFKVEFIVEGYSPYVDTCTIVVKKYTPTIEIESTLDKIYDTLAIVNPSYTIDSNGEVTISYYQNNELLTYIPINAGTYSIVISSAETDTYLAGRIEQEFEISRAKIGLEGDTTAQAFVQAIPAQGYNNGEQIKPSVVIKHNINQSNIYQLILNKDYTTMYGANYKLNSKGYVYISGLENYYTDPYVKAEFDIIENIINSPLGAIEIEIIVEYESVIYNTEAHNPTVIINDITDGRSIEILTEYYTLSSWTNNINVGQATANIEFKNGYSGTATATFNITQYTLQEGDVEVVFDENNNATVTVTINGNIVSELSHYTVTINEDQSVTISGYGNCAGVITRAPEPKYEGPSVLTLTDNSIFGFYTHNGRKWNAVTHETYTDSTDIYLKCVTEFVENLEIVNFLKGVFINSSEFVRITNIKGELITDYNDTCIGTGCVIELVVNEEILDSITVIIIGDLDGNGKLTMNDGIEFAGVSNKEEDNKILYYASDANHSGKVDSDDVLLLIELW